VTSPNKPSRPSRAYIHVVSTEFVAALSDTVRQASFQDARNTLHDPILLGPPSLEFAPYAKTPGSRSRKDARQGTIDQDSDFIAFLESLTQPISRPAGVDSPADGEERKKEAVMTTPLVQFIKDKKASKSKDGSGSKSKHSRSEKESKQEKVQAKKLLQRADRESPATSSDKKVKGEKTSKDSAKSAKGNASSTKAGKSGATSTSTKEPGAAPERKRERGNAAAATKILQRDLGLIASGGRRRGKGAATDTASPKNESSRESSIPTGEMPKKEAKPAKNTPATSNNTKSKDGESSSRTDAPPTPANLPAKSKGGKPKAPSNAKQAFLKHANPSQGVTEALLESAFNSFGAVTKVEIDKKKGFGYVDFAEPEALRKAIAASPVSVAQSQVVVLERKENPGSEKSRKGREAFSANKAKTVAVATGEPAGSGAGAGAGAAGSVGGNTGSSRGSRGGRGSRNKGPKGGGSSEKATGEAKST
jgi:regulator of nonsense transcripts 3